MEYLTVILLTCLVFYCRSANMFQNSLRPNLYSLTSKIISKSGTTQQCQKNVSWLLSHGKYKSCLSIPTSCYPFSTTCCLQQTKGAIVESSYKPMTIPDNLDFGSFILSQLEKYKDRPLIVSMNVFSFFSLLHFTCFYL